MSMHNPAQPQLRGKLPGGLTPLLTLYLLATVALYNGFLPVPLSSRIPLFGFMVASMPVLLHRLLTWRSERTMRWMSLGGFLGGFMIIEIIHLFLGSPEIVGIITLFGLLLMLKAVERYDQRYLMRALKTASIAYLIIFYPLALLNGMVGVGGQDKGIFVSQFIPSLGAFIVNPLYPSGRGTIGLIGSTLAVLVLLQAKETGLSLQKSIQLGLGIFALLVSDSRGTILAFFLIAAVILLPLALRFKVRLLFALPLVILLSQPLAVFNLESMLPSDSFKLVSRSGIDASDQSRVAVWLVSLNMLTESYQSLILGHGSEETANRIEGVFQAWPVEMEILRSPHNMLLELLLDGGIVLAVLFISFIARISIKGWIYSRHLKLSDTGSVAVVSMMLAAGFFASIVDVGRLNEAMFLLMISLMAVNLQIKGLSLRVRHLSGMTG